MRRQLVSMIVLFWILCMLYQLYGNLAQHREYAKFIRTPSVNRELVLTSFTPYFGTSPPDLIYTSNGECAYLRDLAVNPVLSPFDIPCRITYDRAYIRRSEAIVFHSPDLEDLEGDFPAGPRDFLIPWVYLNQECPAKYPLNSPQFRSVFNWTMTYRRDSDVFHPYGRLLSKPTTIQVDPIGNKTKLVAWIASNCEDTQSQREHLINELRNHISVDVYGGCGSSCPVKEYWQCQKYVAATYKFYLSFENSLCLDYISEKFYWPLEAGTILPVVFGGASYLWAPNHSYIDARKFSSPKELAAYLQYLDHDDNAYREYFEWRKHFQVLGANKWCGLCQRVYEYKTGLVNRTAKGYENIETWWNRKPGSDMPVCVDPPKSLVGFKNKWWTEWIKWFKLA